MISISTKFTTTLLFCICLMMGNKAVFAQCMLRPISLQVATNNASVIIEGKVINAKCLWDEQAKNIYTLYDVEVYQYYKGNATQSIIKIVDAGGIVGLQKDVVTNDLHLRIGNAGIFMLVPTNDPFSGNLNYMETYAGPQGFIAYNNVDKKASSVFETFNDVQTNLKDVIINNVGLTPTIIKSLDWTKIVDERNEEHHHEATTNFQIAQSSFLQANTFSGFSSNQLIASSATITSFSPSSINAGADQTLTINGTGFGATRGTSAVQFRNSDDGGLSFIAPLASQYISWSNTQIQVKVPSPAGTGTFRVTDGSNTVNSSTALNIDYHLTNFNYNIGVSDTAYLAKHINANGTGGYSFQCFTGFASNVPAFTDFTNLSQAWRCTSGINWIIGANTSVNTIANDGTNVVRFDIGSELPNGVLGVATSRYNGCYTGNKITFYVQEIDVVFDNATNWFYGNVGTPTFSQTDFYSVGVHELGHGHQMGHVIDPAKIMHYSISSGIQNRTLSPSEIAGGNYMTDYAKTNPYCGEPLHIPYSCVPKVALAASANSINENGASLTIIATMDGINDSNIIINLATSGLAISGSVDYSLPTSIVVPAGTNTASVTMTIVNDALYEGNETAIIDITSVTNGTEDGVQQQTITIIDNDVAPTATLSINNNSIAENSGTTTITATLSAISGLATTINLLYTNGMGMSNAEYTSANTIVIPAGSISANIVLNSVDDALDENNETITVQISTITNGTFTTAQPKIITVIDDEFAEFDLFENTTAITNNSTQNLGNVSIASVGTKTFTLTNNGNSILNCSVNITGTNANRFTIIASGITNILPSASVQLDVEVAPACGDSFITANIVFTNNDDNENPTTIVLTATAIDAPPVPNMVMLPTIYGNCNATVTAPAASDLCSGQIIGTTTNATIYNTQGTFTITWQYVDGNGNTVIQTQSVIINDTLAPVPNIINLPTITANCDTTITVYPTATDNCNGTIIATTSSAVSFTGAGTYTIAWEYIDGKGNATTQNQIIEILGSKPIIVLANNFGSTCENSLASLSATAGIGDAITWSNGIVNGQTFVVATSAIYTVTATTVLGCTSISTASITMNALPQIANALSNNTASVAGNLCDSITHIDGGKIGYTDENCYLIAKINDTLGGNVLGNVVACLQVDAITPLFNGQPYLARHFDIIPSSQGPASITFYYTQADFDNFNSTATTLGFPPILPNGNGQLLFTISQVPGGSLSNANGATTVAHNVIASWDAINSRWQATINVNSFSGFFAHATNPNNIPLGITDITLYGTANNIGQILQWQTSKENNIISYQVMHSNDGVNFVQIHQQIANNIIDLKINEYLHNNFEGNHHFYKIIGSLQNSTKLISNTIVLDSKLPIEFATVYPNPANDIVNVNTQLELASQCKFIMRDAIGKIVKIINADVLSGTNSTSIGVQELASGYYTLQIIANGKTIQTLPLKIIK